MGKCNKSASPQLEDSCLEISLPKWSTVLNSVSLKFSGYGQNEVRFWDKILHRWSLARFLIESLFSFGHMASAVRSRGRWTPILDYIRFLKCKSGPQYREAALCIYRVGLATPSVDVISLATHTPSQRLVSSLAPDPGRLTTNIKKVWRRKRSWHAIEMPSWGILGWWESVLIVKQLLVLIMHYCFAKYEDLGE